MSPIEDGPTGLPLDWPTLLAVAARLGVEVYGVDAHGAIVQVTEPPPGRLRPSSRRSVVGPENGGAVACHGDAAP